MQISEKPFFFKGNWFDTAEEMFEFIETWNKQPLNGESADSILKMLSQDIKINAIVYGSKFTNGEFQKYVEECFLSSMEILYKRISK